MDTVIPKGTHIPSDEPQSPKSTPEDPPPPTEKDSPPTAPTSTWTNLHESVEMEDGRERERKGEGEVGEKEASLSCNREPSPPLGGLLSGRRRSSSTRSSMESEENELSITVRQEADSTVNFEPSLSEPLGGESDHPPCKRARDCSEDEKYNDMVHMEGKERRKEQESFLASSSHLVMTLLESQAAEPEAVAGREEGGRGRVLSEAGKTEEELSSNSLKDGVVSDSSDSEQLSLTEKGIYIMQPSTHTYMYMCTHAHT